MRLELTSAGSVKLGIWSVGIGGTVYTMKSASATRKPAAAATMKEVKCILATTIKGAATMYKESKSVVSVAFSVVITKNERRLERQAIIGGAEDDFLASNS